MNYLLNKQISSVFGKRRGNKIMSFSYYLHSSQIQSHINAFGDVECHEHKQ